jgi:hypothetical protein
MKNVQEFIDHPGPGPGRLHVLNQKLLFTGPFQEEYHLSLPISESVPPSVCLSHSVDVRVTVLITGQEARRAQHCVHIACVRAHGV